MHAGSARDVNAQKEGERKKAWATGDADVDGPDDGQVKVE